MKDSDDFWAGSVRSRRSIVFVDDQIQEFGEDLLENLSKVDSFSDENILRSVAKTLKDNGENRRIDALSLEIGPSNKNDPKSERAYTYRHSVCITGDGDFLSLDHVDATEVVSDILDDVIDNVVEHKVDAQAIDLFFYHPLAGKSDIDQMTQKFSSTRSTLTDHTLRLKAAMRIILVQSAKQIVVSYRKILLEQAERLRVGEDSKEVAMDTMGRILDVTERVSELAVTYLKNATRDVIDTSVNDVKIVLGRMTENREIEPIAEINDFEEEESERL
eukprot:GFUD01029613.1.p1 GENE.GFUD01029613.1~~GFUD01029613.1.p1  ORF type:complete len:275 (-),score=78.98 GFUD01029613.1:316-1140(-)